MTMETYTPLQPGDRAPGFTLPIVNREGILSLEDFRGKSAVLVGFFRGLH
jgi:peroxiredoxin